MTAPRLSGLRRVFVDTSALYAPLDESDSNHRPAISIMTRLAAEPSQLLTTNWILAEAHALTLSRLGRHAALQFLEAVDTSSTRLIRVTAADEERARAILRQYDDKDFSLTDASSFAVMERLRMSEAFSFDRNFSQYGLTVLAE